MSLLVFIFFNEFFGLVILSLNIKCFLEVHQMIR